MRKLKHIKLFENFSTEDFAEIDKMEKDRIESGRDDSKRYNSGDTWISWYDENNKRHYKKGLSREEVSNFSKKLDDDGYQYVSIDIGSELDTPRKK